MKSLDNKNIKNTFLAMSLILPLTTQGQIVDWLVDQIKGEIKNTIYGEVNKVLNYNENRLGSIGSWLWDSVVGAKRESDLKDKAKELKNVHIDRSFLDRAPSNYPNRDKYWTSYPEIAPLLYDQAESYFHQKKNISLSKVGEAQIDKYAQAYIDSVAAPKQVHNINEVLSSVVLDSINVIDNINLLDSLNKDIQSNPRIATVLNNHPEMVRVYYNTITVPELRQDTKHLYYWGINADSHRNKLPKKQRLVNPRFVTFTSNGKTVEIKSGNEKLGTLESNILYVDDINLMNLNGRPSTTYVFDESTWTTDNYGRVEAATQRCDKENKHKSKQKTKLKVKNCLKNIVDNEDYKEIGYFNLLDFGAPDVMLNSYVYEKSPENKSALKLINKEHKNNLKNLSLYKRKTSVSYCNNEIIPHEISIGENSITNNGLILIGQVQMAPEKKFSDTPGGEKTAANYKTQIVKKTTGSTDKIQGVVTKSNSVDKSSSKAAKSSTTSSSTKKASSSYSSVDDAVNKLRKSYGLNASNTKIERYKGTIGKYPIVMTIAYDLSTSKAVGALYYTSQGPDKILTLKGDVGGNHTVGFEFDEYDKGKYNGHFDLSSDWAEVGEEMTGTYGNIKNKSYNVTLIRKL